MRNSYRRINITLPESTVTMLDSLADKGTRSIFIDEAIREHAKKLRRSHLRDQLKEGAIIHRTRDVEIAQEWFHLEDEL